MNSSKTSSVVATVLACAVFLTSPSRAAATDPVATREMERKNDWVGQYLLAKQGQRPEFFSFIYGEQASGALVTTWDRQTRHNKLDNQRTEHLLSWKDRRTGLVVRCRAVEYHDFPTVEWTLSFRNNGPQSTPILERIQALDLTLKRAAPGEFVLHHQTGDNCSAHSYEPHETRLEARSEHVFAPDGGRPTNGAYPYFNVAYDGGGLIAAIGWPGQWAARFARDQAAGLRVAAGQERTHFKLLPGEEVRSPLVVLQFWEGDRVRSQNAWRRWMVAHNLPRPGGKLPAPFTSACMGLHQSEASEVGYIDAYLAGGAKLDYWWMDAGWYPCHDWPETGTWEPDPARFPRGIRAVSDHAHARGMKTVLWFEPERVHAGSWLFEKHPAWILGSGGDRLLNLGNPEAQRWLTDHIDHFLTAQGIDLYRQDFNIDPLSFWRANDPDDRQGITEIRHVEGYLAFWDELRRRHPDLLIDSCASGGRRNDLETLRRAVPLLRSDFQGPQNPTSGEMMVGNQGHTYGLSFWVPYYGTGVFYDNVYAVRSHLTPAFGIGYPAGSAQVDWATMRRRIDDWKQVADDFLGDYYPLTPYSLSERDWIAWQFDRPATGSGMVQAFRRPRSDEESRMLKLRGLDPAAVYELRNLDLESGTRATGRTLMSDGLRATLPRRPQALLVKYRRLDQTAAVISEATSACEAGQRVALSGADSRSPGVAIAGYHWELGDGTADDGPRIEHAYSKPGNFTVRLTVRNQQGLTDTTTTVVTVSPVDTTPPALVAAASGRPDRVTVTFSEPVDAATTETAANYAIDPGVKVVAAVLAPGSRAVTLTTSPLTEGTTYALTVNRVCDRAARPHAIATDSRTAFRYSGLYAWWRLDDTSGGTAIDSSGNGHHAALSGNDRGPTSTPSARGQVLRFDGKADVVETDTSLPDLAMPFTIALWVNPASTQVEHADIFGNHGEPFVGLSLQQQDRQTNAYGFGFGDGKRWQGTGPVALQADQWQHVAVVCDGRDAILYVNGIEKSRTPAPGPLAVNPNQNFKLGQGYHSGRYFHGMLSDARIYRKALSAVELGALVAGAGASALDDVPGNIVGMYIHQHWPYNHPYAARTWTVDDYRGYCGDLRKLGYNALMIWPVLETMPDPPTPSDLASLRKIATVVEVLHGELGMRVYIALCPNVAAKNVEAAKTPFERRHFFETDTRVNPADRAATAAMVGHRERLLGLIRKVDGVVIIDSDPGGYPGSTNAEFVDLLMEHRRMLDRLRPGIELVYWVHVGWPAYGRWYQTGKFNFGTESEYVEALTRLKERDPKPWGIANGLKYAEKCGLAGKVISFNYGAIEGEPSMPLTRFDTAGAYAAGRNKGPRGVMGNAQTHCVQLPNTFAFARGATGKPLARPDLVAFAEKLIPGQGELIVAAWEHVESTDTAAMCSLADRLERLRQAPLPAGEFPGLLFGDPDRFVADLISMLRLRAAFNDFVAATATGTDLKTKLRVFTNTLASWHRRTGYMNIWDWAHLREALARLGAPEVDRVIGWDMLNPAGVEGATPFEKVANGLRRGESFTPDLIEALSKTYERLK
jgi:alpha-galactosidase